MTDRRPAAALEDLEARKTVLEEELVANPPPPIRLHPNLAQVYRAKVERLHEALADPGLRDEALGILRGLIERVVIHSAEDGLLGEIVGEIVKMVELGLDAKQAALPKEAACSVKVVAGPDLDQDGDRDVHDRARPRDRARGHPRQCGGAGYRGNGDPSRRRRPRIDPRRWLPGSRSAGLVSPRRSRRPSSGCSPRRRRT